MEVSGQLEALAVLLPVPIE